MKKLSPVRAVVLISTMFLLVNAFAVADSYKNNMPELPAVMTSIDLGMANPLLAGGITVSAPNLVPGLYFEGRAYGGIFWAFMGDSSFVGLAGDDGLYARGSIGFKLMETESMGTFFWTLWTDYYYDYSVSHGYYIEGPQIETMTLFGDVMFAPFGTSFPFGDTFKKNGKIDFSGKEEYDFVRGYSLYVCPRFRYEQMYSFDYYLSVQESWSTFEGRYYYDLAFITNLDFSQLGGLFEFGMMEAGFGLMVNLGVIVFNNVPESVSTASGMLDDFAMAMPFGVMFQIPLYSLSTTNEPETYADPESDNDDKKGSKK